ncbi:hypothetical protein COP2_000114 [Malus domestica]
MEEDDKSPQKLTRGHECNLTDIDLDEHFNAKSDNDSKKHIIIESNHFPPNAPDYTENLNTANTPVNEGAQLCASGDVWKVVNVPHSYYDSRNDAQKCIEMMNGRWFGGSKYMQVRKMV